MNRENLLRVADAIERHEIPDLGFNMNSWVDTRCGTTACGAGWAVAIKHGFNAAQLADLEAQMDFNSEHSSIFVEAASFLDLTPDEARGLFCRWPDEVDITPTMAAATYRYAAKHGVVDWHAACAHLLPRDDA